MPRPRRPSSGRNPPRGTRPPRFETPGDDDELGRLGSALRAASEEVGFYRLVGHGVPRSETDAILGEARRFHSLPDDVKGTIEMDRRHRRRGPGDNDNDNDNGDDAIGGVGYLAYGNRKLPTRETPNRNAAFLVKADHRIGFDRNRWPDEEALPGFRRAVERYATIVTALAQRLLPLYATALDLEPTYFGDAFEEPLYRLRMTHYPASSQERDSARAAYGISPHVDTSFFTLLLTDGTPGLNIYSQRRGEWIRMPDDGPARTAAAAAHDQEGNDAAPAFVVNSGELLRQWSNDRFLSARHFVSNPTAANGRDRYSVPFFFSPNSDHRMVCLPSCHGPDRPPKYPPFSYNESQAVVQGE